MLPLTMISHLLDYCHLISSRFFGVDTNHFLVKFQFVDKVSDLVLPFGRFISYNCS